MADRKIDTDLPSDSEWAILDALWAQGPATAPQVAELLKSSRGWAYSTVKTMLDRMAKKSLVDARRVGATWEYTAAVEPREARAGAWRRFVASAFGGAMSPALRFIAQDARLSKRERAQLRQLLETTKEQSL